jgi:hypothetical protein
MVLRFVILFVGLIIIQLVALNFPGGFQRIYAPFDYLVRPLVRRHYGSGEGSLLPLIFWGNLLGTFIYSAVLAIVGAFLISRGLSKSSSDD